MLAEQQQAQEAATPRPVNQSDDPLLKRFTWRSIGPAVMGGRVDDIAADESNPSVIYVGYATGGLWKTVNNGTTWTPIFDEYPVSSIGDIELAPSNPNILYVGTGEPNNRQSSSFGAGVYKSTDGGGKFEVHGAQRNAEHRPYSRTPEGSEHRLRRRGRTPLRTKPAARPLQDDRRRQDLDEHEVHRQRHGFHRCRHASHRSEYAHRRLLSAPAPALGIQRRRNGQRHLADERRGQDVDARHRQRSPDEPSHWPHRAQLQSFQAERHLRAARSRPERRNGSGRQRGRDAHAAWSGSRRRWWWPGRRRNSETRSHAQRRLAIRRWRQVVDVHEQQQQPPDVLQQDPRRPDQSGDRVYDRGQRIQVGRRRTDVQHDGRHEHSDHHALWINPRNSQHLVIGNDGGVDVSYDQGETWEEISLAVVGPRRHAGLDATGSH